MLSLAAFYAPRGIPPAQILAASPSELALLAEAREMYQRETFTVMYHAVCAALSEDAAKEAFKIYG